MGLSIKRKLVFGFFLASLSSIFIGALAVFSLKLISGKATSISSNNLVDCVTIGFLIGKSRGLQIAVSELARTGPADPKSETLIERVEEYLSDYTRYDGMYRSNEQGEEERAVFEKQNKLWEPLKPKLEALIAAAKEKKATPEQYAEFLAGADTHAAEIEGLLAFQNDEGFKQAQGIKNLSKNILWAMLGGAGFFFLFAIAMGWFYASSLTKTLKEFSSHLMESSGTMGNEANQMHDVSQYLGGASLEQASAVRESAATADLLSSTIKRNAENSSISLTQASSCRQAAIDGVEAVREVITSFDSIHTLINKTVNQFDDSNRKISDVLNTIKEINDKTKFINDIVFQTKLLSFNASVEAARAGEHGRGFAVVAEEVGKLAVMSGNAASQISNLLQAGVKKVEELVDVSRDRGEQLRTQAEGEMEKNAVKTQRCQEVFENIVKNVEEVVTMVQEIAEASRDQAAGVNELSTAFVNLDTSAQKNSSTTEQVMGIAARLKEQGEILGSVATALNSLIEGQRRKDSVSEQTEVAKAA